MMLKLMYITNRIDIAQICQNCGVDYIWIDLEVNGKEQRQAGLDTVKSRHTIDDIKKIKPYIDKSRLMVRVNPWNEMSQKEVDEVINAGADIVMLPMWRTEQEVKEFINCVNRRARTCLLLETIDAEKCLDKILSMDGIDEIHIGLNDLHLEYGLTFMFELLANGTVERICNKIKKAGIPYGFGGVGKIGDGLLKADNIIVDHYRLGSSSVILSRSFCNTEEIKDLSIVKDIFESNVRKLRNLENEIIQTYNEDDFVNNKKQVIDMVQSVVDVLKND